MDKVTFSKVYPIVAVRDHGNGVFIVKRECTLQGDYQTENGRKDRKIKMLTPKALSNLVATIQATEIKFLTMLTLTYPKIYPRNGQTVKQDLNAILAMLRSRGQFDYLWFLEFQKRGAPHIHILTSHQGISPSMRIAVANSWVSRIIKSEWFQNEAIMQSIECETCEYDIIQTHLKAAFAVALHRDTWQLVREKDGAKRYVTKYATKPEQKIVPKNYRDVGRFWGCSKNVSLGEGREIKTDESKLQEFLEQTGHKAAEFDVIPKYLWDVKMV